MKLFILCYHKVGPESEEGRWLNVAPKTLESHGQFFLRRGYRFIRARELALEWPSRAVCFTFDDAYESTLTDGLAVLEKLQVTASIFAVSHFVGKASSWDAGLERPLASWEQLLVASQAGMEIGNHTASHCDLSLFSLEEQHQEMAKAQQVLKEKGFQQESICYPYGKYNGDTLQAASSLGFSIGLGLGIRAAVPSDNRLALPRIVVSFGDRLPKLLYKLYLRPYLPGQRKRPHYIR